MHFFFLRLLVLRLAIVGIVYFLLRCLFLALHSEMLPHANLNALFLGLRFDAAAILTLNLPIVVLHLFPSQLRSNTLIKQITLCLFLLVNTVGYLLNSVDLGYFPFTQKRSTFDLFHLMGLGSDIWSLLPVFLKDYWYVVLAFLLCFFLTYWLYQQTEKLKPPPQAQSHHIAGTIVMLFFALLTVFGIRGGFQARPINMQSAGQSTHSSNIPLVLNTTFTMIQTWGKSELKDLNYLSQEELNQYFEPVKQYKAAHLERPNRPNVVVIVLESFSREFIGIFNNGLGCTPFLDSLIQKSLAFENAYANGVKSIEAMPAILSGIPALMNTPYTTSVYSGNQIASLPDLLRQMGYSTSFFHGGNSGTMGFDLFAEIAGFERYFGREEFNDDSQYDGTWGIYDDAFLVRFAREMNNEKTPFFSTLLTLSSHHPFEIPERYKKRFQSESHPIRKAVAYTDYSLRLFFEEAQKMSWFENTLFCITADHGFHSKDPKYGNTIGMYAIPLLFYKENSNLIGRSDVVTQQCDIMPSLLHYLGYSHPFVCFGESLFDSSASHFAVSYINELYQLITDQHVLRFDGKESRVLFEYKTDTLLKHNVHEKRKALLPPLEKRLKAIIQEFNHRMIHNELKKVD